MADETIWTDEDVQTLKKAIASGVLSVSYDGPPRRQIVYQSTAEMRQTLSQIRAELRAADSAGGTRYRLVGTRKGF